MGLLDDAIRDHLELKRRRGADPEELARAEQEALGPVRREPFPSAESPSANQSGSAPAAVLHDGEGPVAPSYEHEGDLSSAPARPAGLGEAEYDEYYEEEYYDEEEGVEWEEPRGDLDFERGDRHGIAEEPPTTVYRSTSTPLPDPTANPVPETDPEAEARGPSPSSEAATPPPRPPATPRQAAEGEETVEYELDEGLAAPEGHREGPPAVTSEDQADMLEETPEFLQDAPEHDRLWFEQRPPRDFDFDD